MQRIALPLTLLWLNACSSPGGGSPRTPSSERSTAASEPSALEVPRTIVTPEGASSVPELMKQAEALAAKEQWQPAAAAFERLYRLDPEGASANDALWGAADAYDRAGDSEAALARYELLAPRIGGTPRAREAQLRAARLSVFLGRYARAGLLADKLLTQLEALRDVERIAVLSAKALALIERGDEQNASYFIEKARDVIETRRLDAAGRVPRDLAQLYYALGETRRLRAERISFEPMPPDFAAVLEARCQLLLDAQSAYSDSMRAYDAHWSAMAGFRVAELYQHLHRDLQAVRPPPSAATERQRQLFSGAVKLRYSILLTKARSMAEHTLAMAERTGERSEWVDRTRKALASIERAVAEEEAALARLPYTRQDFEQYFAEMEKAAASAAKKGAKPSGAPGGALQ